MRTKKPYMSFSKEEIPGTCEGARIAMAHTAERDMSILTEGLEKIMTSPEDRATDRKRWENIERETRAIDRKNWEDMERERE